MKVKPVKTAVIGCGMISSIYLSNLKERFSIIDLVGCSDLVEEKSRAQAEKYGIRQMTNEEILSNPEIELVLNLTYPTSHFEVSKSILEAGKHCYSEKIMCITDEEADCLDELRKKNNVMFTIAPDTILGSGMQLARYVIDKGLIGKPIMANAYLARSYQLIKSEEEDAYRKFSVMCEGGGIPYDMGGYYLHQLFNMFGPASRVCGFSKTRNQNRPYLNPLNSNFNDSFFVNTPNTISASLEFDCGVWANLAITSDCCTTENQFCVIGTEGILNIGDPNEFGDKTSILKSSGEYVELPKFFPFSENSRGVGAADMAWALRTGRPSRLSFEMGRHTLEVINAIKVCDDTNEVQLLKTKFERPKPLSTEFYSGASEERSLFIY